MGSRQRRWTSLSGVRTWTCLPNEGGLITWTTWCNWIWDARVILVDGSLNMLNQGQMKFSWPRFLAQPLCISWGPRWKTHRRCYGEGSGQWRVFRRPLPRTERGVVVAGPPCSLYVWISRGTHSRCSHGYDIYGNQRHLCIRMSNAIVRNFATWFHFYRVEALQKVLNTLHGWKSKVWGLHECAVSIDIYTKCFFLTRSLVGSCGNVSKAWLLKSIHGVRDIFWILEQPTSSQMFLVPEMDEALRMWGLWLTTTWLGCFGHVLWNGTKLMTNLPNGSECFGLCRDMPVCFVKTLWLCDWCDICDRIIPHRSGYQSLYLTVQKPSVLDAWDEAKEEVDQGAEKGHRQAEEEDER